MTFRPAPLALALLAVLPLRAAADGLPRAGTRPVSPFQAPSRPLTRLLHDRAGAALTPPSGASAADAARSFVQERLAPAGDMELVAESEGACGVSFVTFEQRFGGVPVALGRVTVAVLPDGSVLSARVGELAPRGPARAAVHAATPAKARAAALRALGAREDAPDAVPEAEPEAVLVATRDGAVPAWRVAVTPDGRLDGRVQVLVADDGGGVLRADPLTLPAVARARVYPQDPARGSELRDLPHPVLRPSVHSPAGWSDALVTVGNNVRAQLDREADFDVTPGLTLAASGDPPALDFTPTGDPSRAEDAAAAVTNVWWALNEAHDRFRRLGFDEPSGAMQRDGYGRGGAAGDQIHALVQYATVDGTYPYGSTFLGVGADGTFTYLVVGVYEDESGALRDGALETDLLVHEYAHGVSVRLVGDDAGCMAGLQSQAISEGWSDYFAASFTDDAVIGAWTSGRADRGHRLFPVGASPFTVANFCETDCDRFADGEIWSGFLWDLRLALVARHGAAGEDMADRLVVASLRHAPCRPTFVGARDALLIADTVLHGGAHRCDVWAAAAGRGMGFSADTAGPDDRFPRLGFDLPPECRNGAALELDAAEYGTDDDGVVRLLDPTPAAGADVRLACSGGDALTLPLEPVPGGPLLRAAFRLEPGPVDPADGVLQCAAGETLAATHQALAASAAVSGAASVVVLDHHVWGNWCQVMSDDDVRNGWWNVPGFLDAGEVATINLTLGNATEDDLEDVEVTVSSSNPLVRVLPTGPQRVGDVRRRGGTGPRPFALEVRAEASPSVQPGDRATLRFDVRSRGRAGVATLELELSMDYVEDVATSPFAGGVETFDPSSPTAAAWTAQAARGTLNGWAAEDCAGVGGRWGWRQGSRGCAPYPDGQVAAVLVSPPILPLPADAVAIRMSDVSWSNDVRLWTDPANPYCDADILAVYDTLDPPALPYDTPLDVYETSPRRVWLFPENTGGHVRQGPWYVDRNPQPLVAGYPYEDLRLAWVFWGDAIDCGFETLNDGFVALDDVRVTYDVLRKVPETTPCASDCNLLAPLAIDPPGGKCDGEAFLLRAPTTETQGCAGAVYYSFSGPGVPGSSGWTTTPEAPAVGQDGATYAVYAQCETEPQCSDYRSWTNVSPARPGLGGPWPGSLRVRRDGADVVLSWTGGAAPAAYGAWKASTRAQLAAGVASWPLAGAIAGEEPDGSNAWRDAGASASRADAYYLVLGRDPCTDAPRLP